MFDWLFRRKTVPTSAATPGAFLCSACWQVFPTNAMHALPWWNPEARAFFMTTRCADCFPASLEQARNRVRGWDPEAEASFRSFLDIWKLEARMPHLAGLAPREAAETVLANVEESRGRDLAAVFLAAP